MSEGRPLSQGFIGGYRPDQAFRDGCQPKMVKYLILRWRWRHVYLTNQTLVQWLAILNLGSLLGRLS